MTCEHCCGADRLFDLKGAKKDLKKYKKKGPSKITKKLINALSDYEKKDKTLLDIGGGIGAIAWHFHENGALSTTDVDASSGYIKVAREFAAEKGWESNTDFKLGDITDVSDELPKYDFVTMDKVVCCYPDYEQILTTAISKTEKVIALTFPLGGPITNLLRSIGSIFLKLKKNPFRPYIHSSEKIEEVIRQNGFIPVHQSISFPWRIWVFTK